MNKFISRLDSQYWAKFNIPDGYDTLRSFFSAYISAMIGDPILELFLEESELEFSTEADKLPKYLDPLDFKLLKSKGITSVGEFDQYSIEELEGITGYTEDHLLDIKSTLHPVPSYVDLNHLSVRSILSLADKLSVPTVSNAWPLQLADLSWEKISALGLTDSVAYSVHHRNFEYLESFFSSMKEHCIYTDSTGTHPLILDCSYAFCNAAGEIEEITTETDVPWAGKTLPPTTDYAYPDAQNLDYTDKAYVGQGSYQNKLMLYFCYDVNGRDTFNEILSDYLEILSLTLPAWVLFYVSAVPTAKITIGYTQDGFVSERLFESSGVTWSVTGTSEQIARSATALESIPVDAISNIGTVTASDSGADLIRRNAFRSGHREDNDTLKLFFMEQSGDSAFVTGISWEAEILTGVPISIGFSSLSRVDYPKSQYNFDDQVGFMIEFVRDTAQYTLGESVLTTSPFDWYEKEGQVVDPDSSGTVTLALNSADAAEQVYGDVHIYYAWDNPDPFIYGTAYTSSFASQLGTLYVQVVSGNNYLGNSVVYSYEFKTLPQITDVEIYPDLRVVADPLSTNVTASAPLETFTSEWSFLAPNPTVTQSLDYDKVVVSAIRPEGIPDTVPMYYTLDGSDPTASSRVYTTPLEFTAIGVYLVKFKLIGDVTSGIGLTSFTLSKLASPIISVSDTMPGRQSVGVADINSSESFFTTDGSDPTISSSSSTYRTFLIDQTNNAGTITVKTFSRAKGFISSDISELTYTVEKSSAPSVRTSSSSTEVSVVIYTDATQTAPFIYYTLDGSTPNSSSSLYTEAFSVQHSTTLSSISMERGKAVSDVTITDLFIEGTGYVNFEESVYVGFSLDYLVL